MEVMGMLAVFGTHPRLFNVNFSFFETFQSMFSKESHKLTELKMCVSLHLFLASATHRLSLRARSQWFL